MSKPESKSDRQLFIGNLHFDADDRMLEDAFRTLGIKIASARVMLDKETGRSRGFAFVDLASDEPWSADEVIEAVRGYEFYDRPCRADRASQRAKPSGKSRDRRPSRRDDDWG